MSRFRVSERRLRNKDEDDDGTNDEALAWINRCITNLNVEINNLEGHDASKKQKRQKEQQASVYREHLSKFEAIRDSLENGVLQPDDLTDIRDEIDNFIESIKQCYSEMDFDIY